jgi:hypothetical protein
VQAPLMGSESPPTAARSPRPWRARTPRP